MGKKGFVVVVVDSLDGHPQGSFVEMDEELIPRLEEMGAAQRCEPPKPEPPPASPAKPEAPKGGKTETAPPPPVETDKK